MKAKSILILLGLLISAGIASAYLINDKILPTNLPDGRNVADIPRFEVDTEIYNITDMVTLMEANNESLGELYYKIIVLNGTQWELSSEFAESRPQAILKPFVRDSGEVKLNAFVSRQFTYLWATNNIKIGDRLYTNDASANSSLRGTVTSLYNLNYKTRMYVCSEVVGNDCNAGFWKNFYVGASTNPAVYNRRGFLHIDALPIAIALESGNFTEPTLIKVFFG